MKTANRRYKYKGDIKGHQITDAEIDAVVMIYDKYEANRGGASDELLGADLPVPLREAIQAAFEKTHEGRTLYALRQLLLTGVDLCPVCGIDPPSELDHHLPQSAFKPLAIHARNLVPLCHLCNNAKLAGFGEDGEGFLHAYYDALPDIDFVQATIGLAGDALIVSFSIDATAVLPAGYRDRLTGQMLALGLETRYQQEVNTYVSSHAAALHMAYRGKGQAGVRMMLKLQTRYETNAFHRNHWRPALLRALTDLDEFTNGGFTTVLPISTEMLEDLEGFE